MFLVKLGGSVLTDKSRLRTLRRKNLARLARELARAKGDGIVVHGAGSFGHIRAKRARLHRSARNPSQVPAVVRVQRDVRELDLAVVGALNAVGRPSVSLPPSAIARSRDGRLAHLDVAPFRSYLSRGVTPVTFGDVVLDEVRGFSICSGDDLMLELAEAFHPERVCFVADVDGVFTADPKTSPRARLLPVVSPATFGSVETSTPTIDDVTGSLEAKLRAMIRIASHSQTCTILNGTVPGRLRDALAGRAIVGTRVAGVA